MVDKLEFSKVRDVVAVHVPCSSKKMGIEESFGKLAGMCAHEVGRREGGVGHEVTRLAEGGGEMGRQPSAPTPEAPNPKP